MTFLASIYLWFLPLIAIPIIFHLIKRKKFNTVYFSSLKFFLNIEKDSIKKVNIINILLLIIRTLIILLIILIFSNPVINGVIRNKTISDSTILNICIDNPYSNTRFINTNLNKLIKNIFNNYPDDTRAIVQSTDNRIIIDDFIKNINYDFSNITTYKTLTLINILEDLKSNEYEKYINKDLYLISDFQENIFNDIDKSDSSFNGWNVFSYKHNISSEILALYNLKISDNNIIKDELFNISIECTNLSNSAVNDAKIDFYVNNIKVGENLINLNPGDNDIITFKTSIAETGIHKCFFILNDNKYFFIINIPDSFNAALIYDNYLDAKHIYNLLNTYKDLDINIEIDTLSSMFQSSNRKKYDFMFKFGISDFDNISINALKGSTQKLFLIPNDSYSLNSFIKDRDVSDINLFKINKSSVTLDDSYIKNIVLKNIYNNYKNPYKIYEHYKSPITENTLLSLTNNYSLLDKYMFDNLEIYLFSLPLDIKSSNIPISSSFIPLFDYLLFGDENSKNKYVGSRIHFDNMILNDTIYHSINNKIDLYKSDFILSNGITLYEPGFHHFDLNHNIKYEYSANINPIEFTTEVLTDDKLLGYIPNTILIDEQSNIDELVSSQISGLQIWRYILYILALLIIIEMYLSNIYIYKND